MKKMSNCIVCDKDFSFNTNYSKGKFCSYKCYWGYKIGKQSPRKGIKGVSKKTSIKMRLARIGRHFPKLSQSKKDYYKTHNGYWKDKIFSKPHRDNLSISHKGKYCGSKHPNWKGGIRISDQGYIFVYCPNHPRQRNKYIRRSHFVMEHCIKRYLTKDEVVHHINKIRNDDRIENLKLFKNKSEHRKYHHH